MMDFKKRKKVLMPKWSLYLFSSIKSNDFYNYLTTGLHKYYLYELIPAHDRHSNISVKTKQKSVFSVTIFFLG